MNEEIKQRANYCLKCMKPQCAMYGCPLGNHIPEFIQKVKDEDYQGAYEILCQTTVLPAICGRICPHFKQCQGKCIHGIKGEPVSIGKIEAFIGDWALQNPDSLRNSHPKVSEEEYKKNSKKHIAVIGGGPAGLTCSAFLRQKGFQVTIYEKYDSLGGILKRGIPGFRLQKDILDKKLDFPSHNSGALSFDSSTKRNLAKTINDNPYLRIKLSCIINDYERKIKDIEDTGNPMILSEVDI